MLDLLFEDIEIWEMTTNIEEHEALGECQAVSTVCIKFSRCQVRWLTFRLGFFPRLVRRVAETIRRR